MKTETEVIVLQSNDALDQSLVKENVTEKVIAKLRADYSGLTIQGIEDKEGYKKVDEARKEVKRIRLVAEKVCDLFVGEAHSIHKQRTAKRKEILSQFEEIEKPLLLAQKVVDDEVARLKAIEAEKQKAKIAQRVKDLQEYGYKGDLLAVEFISDEQFDLKLANLKTEFYGEVERVKEEKFLSDWDAAIVENQALINAAQKEIQDAKEKEIADREAKLKADEDKARNERLEIEREKIRLEIDALQTERFKKLMPVTLEQTHSSSVNMQKLWEMSEADFEIVLVNRTAKYNKHLADQKEAEEKAAAKAIADAEEKRIADQKAAEEKEAKDKAEAERIEALKSDKEKMTTWVNSFGIGNPTCEDNETVDNIKDKFFAFQAWAKKEIAALS